MKSLKEWKGLLQVELYGSEGVVAERSLLLLRKLGECVKIVVYSDIQFNPWKEYSKLLPDGMNSRLKDQLDVQDGIFSFCIEQGADILVHTGDLFETLTEKIDKATFLVVYDRFVKFSKANIVTILLVGNHDWVDRTEKAHILEPFSEIENVIVIDEWRTEFVDNVSLGFIPYTRDDFKSKVAQVVAQSTDVKYRYLFSHQGVSGAKVGPRDIPLKTDYAISDFRTDKFDVVFNGHYHKPQVYSNFVIVGSPLQKDQGERNDTKGFWFLDTEKNPRRYIFTETYAPRFYKIETKSSEVVLPEGFGKSDFLWIVSNDPSVSDSKVVRELGERVRVDIQTERITKLRSDISINMSIEEQIGRYVEMCGAELDKEVLTKVGVEKWKRSQ